MANRFLNNITVAGNVGVGTTSPSRSLTVNSGGEQVTALIESTSGVSSQIQIKNSNSNNGGFIKTTGDNVILTANSTGQSHLVVADGGNVGIGATSPYTTLQVGDGTADDATRVYHSDGAYTEMRGYGLQFNRASSYIRPTTDGNKAMFFGTNGATWSTVQFDATQYDFQTNAASRFSIGTNGNATFAGDITVGGNLIVNGTTTTLNTTTVEVEDNILQLNTTQGTPDTATAATSGISVYRGDGVTQASLIFNDADDTWDLTNNLTVADNVGIGTVSPLGKLHVYEAASGQSAPNAAADTLVLDGSSSTGISILNNNAGVGSIFFGDNNDNFVGGFRYNHSDNSLETYTNNALAITITSAGNVGIGTTAPTAKLHVISANAVATDKPTMQSQSVLTVKPITASSGNLNFASINGGAGIGLQYTNGPGTANWDIALQPFGGNVGIGTTSPAYPLDIAKSSGSAYMRLARTYTGSESNILFGAESSRNFIQSRAGTSNGAQRIDFLIGSTQRLSLGTAGQIGLSSTNYGTDGQVLTSKGSGAAAVWQDAAGESYTPLAVTKNGSNQFPVVFANAENFSLSCAGTWSITATIASGDVGKTGTIIITNTATTTPGSLPSTFKTPNGNAVVFQTDNGDVSILSYLVVSTSIVLVNYVGNFS